MFAPDSQVCLMLWRILLWSVLSVTLNCSSDMDFLVLPFHCYWIFSLISQGHAMSELPFDLMLKTPMSPSSVCWLEHLFPALSWEASVMAQVNPSLGSWPFVGICEVWALAIGAQLLSTSNWESLSASQEKNMQHHCFLLLISNPVTCSVLQHPHWFFISDSFS